MPTQPPPTHTTHMVLYFRKKGRKKKRQTNGSFKALFCCWSFSSSELWTKKYIHKKVKHLPALCTQLLWSAIKAFFLLIVFFFVDCRKAGWNWINKFMLQYTDKTWRTQINYKPLSFGENRGKNRKFNIVLQKSVRLYYVQKLIAVIDTWKLKPNFWHKTDSQTAYSIHSFIDRLISTNFGLHCFENNRPPALK